MSDKQFADCCYGSDEQHGPNDPCPYDPIRALEEVMNNPLARTALEPPLYDRIIRITAACGRAMTTPTSDTNSIEQDMDLISGAYPAFALRVEPQSTLRLAAPRINRGEGA